MALLEAPLSRPAYAVPLLSPPEPNQIPEKTKLPQLEVVELGAPTPATEAEQLHLSLPSRPKHSTESTGLPYWVPTSLKRSYLLTLTILSICLGICCFILVVVSHVKSGIADADSSGGFNFRKRFLPIFVAVLYTLLWAPVVTDVIRTEPWALLSRNTGAKAKDSLLKKDQLWWSHIGDAVRAKKQHNGVRWALLVSVIAGLISSLVINPLSAGLLDTARIISTEEKEFMAAELSAAKLKSAHIGDALYLRASSNLLFNVSTSAWNTDKYSVVPFWPSDFAQVPLSATLAPKRETWTVNQLVVSSKLNCRPLTSTFNITKPGYYPESYVQTEDGCAIVATESTDCWGAVWGQISEETSSSRFSKCTAQGFEEYFMFCSLNQDSTGVAVEQGTSRERYITAQVCNTTYSSTRAKVTVSNTLSDTRISIDENVLETAQELEDDSIIDIPAFERDFLSSVGSNHLRPTFGIGNYLGNRATNEEFRGPALALAAFQNYSVDSLMRLDPVAMAKQATIVKQRFLGELLLSSISEATQENSVRTTAGSVTAEHNRLVTNRSVGIALGSILLVLAVAAVSLSLLTSPNRRPLSLYTDPSESSTAALLLKDTEAASSFDHLDRATAKDLKNTLRDEVFILRDGKLRVHSSKSSTPTRLSKASTDRDLQQIPDWRPFTLRRRAGSSLVLCLSCIVAALVAIYVFSLRQPLHQAIFVYSSELSLGDFNITTLAPYSIIPTLVAVGVKLWWGTIDSAYRRLTPFLVMAKSSKLVSRSPSMSYITSPILWITIVAGQRRHWLLFIVTLSALASEVLQISMASLWSREIGVLNFDVPLTAQYELRSVPHAFEDRWYQYRNGENIAYPRVAHHIYGGSQYQISWVYGSLAELAFGASSPAWSKDGWSFLPVDLSNISASIPNQYRLKDGDTSGSMNVSLVNQGLRGRLECTPIDDPSRWVSEIKNLTGLVRYNQTMNDTRPNIHTGFEFTPQVRVVNFTAYTGLQPGEVTIGQWLHFNYSSSSSLGSPLYNHMLSQNFTVLWTNSSYPYRYENHDPRVPSLSFEQPPRLIFAERPQVQALNCQPIFETARARITMDVANKRLEHYELLEDPSPAQHLWSNSFERHFYDEDEYYDGGFPRVSFTDQSTEFNRTVSWGYLFQFGLLGACNAQGYVTPAGLFEAEGVAGPTPFSFIESDLYADPFSYAALAMAGYNRQSLLNAPTLIDVTQRAFTTFFQWFVSTQSGYTGDYWAFQPINATLASDMDFGPLESTVASTYTDTYTYVRCGPTSRTYLESGSESVKLWTPYDCESPTSIWTETATRTQKWTTIFQTPSSTITSHSYRLINTYRLPSARPAADFTISFKSLPWFSQTATPTLASNSSGIDAALRTVVPTASGTSLRSTITPAARVQKRSETTGTPAPGNMVAATVSVHTETLVISSIALFISVAIIAIHIIGAIFIYLVQNKQLELLPRDFDSPASLLAAVCASEKLKSWAEQQQERRSAAQKGTGWRKIKDNSNSEPVDARMGYFTGADGKEYLGIDLVDEHSPLLVNESSNGA